MCAEVRGVMRSDQLFEIVIRIILAVGAHAGRQHPAGRLVLLKALGHHPLQAQMVQRPVRRGGEGLGAIAVTGVFRRDKTILKDNSKPSLASTMVKVLTEESLPQTKESLIDKTMQLYPTLKINCFNTTLSRLHKNEVLNYYNGGLIGIKGKRYGRGYKIISRLHKHKETD